MTQTRLLVLVTSAALTLTTLTVTPGQAVTAPAGAAVSTKAGPGIGWGRCRDQGLRQAGARCGFVTVPMDYKDPSAGSLQIAVSRIRHTTRRSQGVMLVNPGGPGGSGLELATIGGLMPARSGASYDWIGFDPRGVGASRPALSCRPNYFHADRPPYVPSTPAILRAWLARSEAYADSCGDRYGELLDHMKTRDTVRDMERIRIALGARRINFYGYSYGTYLGQVYATLFPQRVRRMVLDSNVDPTAVWYPSGERQTLAFQRAMDSFFRWIARHRETYRLGRTGDAVERLYLKQRRVLSRRPANGLLGPSEWDDALTVAGYAEVVWPILATAFANWVHRGDPRLMLRVWRVIDTPGDDNQYAVFNAVSCTDAPWPGPETVLADARRLFRMAPVPTWASTWFSGPCMFWPAEPGTPVMVKGRGVAALLLSQTRDAATPFHGSLVVRRLFPASRLVAIRGGTTHASSPQLSGACANARLAAYLKTGALPKRKPGRRPDVVCSAPPKPQPSAAATRGGARGTEREFESWAVVD